MVPSNGKRTRHNVVCVVVIVVIVVLVKAWYWRLWFAAGW